jgi:NAD(P)H-dependent flavin oxidoreductase YrpB (nitropropane dioxygenase family)
MPMTTAFDSTSPHDVLVGEVEPLPMWAGQSVGVVREVLPAAEIVRRIAEEAAVALDRARATIRR